MSDLRKISHHDEWITDVDGKVTGGQLATTRGVTKLLSVEVNPVCTRLKNHTNTRSGGFFFMRGHYGIHICT